MAATRWRHTALATRHDAAVFWLLRETRMLCILTHQYQSEGRHETAGCCVISAAIGGAG